MSDLHAGHINLLPAALGAALSLVPHFGQANWILSTDILTLLYAKVDSIASPGETFSTVDGNPL